MAIFKLYVECDNAAFHNRYDRLDPAAELASIIEKVCRDALRDGITDCTLYDSNGNRVGECRLED